MDEVRAEIIVRIKSVSLKYIVTSSVKDKIWCFRKLVKFL